jgi:hypothetical protein
MSPNRRRHRSEKQARPVRLGVKSSPGHLLVPLSGGWSTSRLVTQAAFEKCVELRVEHLTRLTRIVASGTSLARRQDSQDRQAELVAIACEVLYGVARRVPTADGLLGFRRFPVRRVRLLPKRWPLTCDPDRVAVSKHHPWAVAQPPDEVESAQIAVDDVHPLEDRECVAERTNELATLEVGTHEVGTRTALRRASS